MSKNFSLSVVAIAAILGMSAAQADELEVLHWWTSGGEAKAAAELKKQMEAEGHTWKDFAVAGGGGDSAMTVLKSRVISGNAPAAAQIKGPALQEWAAEGVLANIDDVAKAEKWDAVLPPVVANVMKYKGHYIAAPVNVHRVNWLWANPDAFKKAGAKVPTTWDEFFVAGDKLKAAGIIPLAHGGQNWQDFTVFEDVAVSVGGTDFYRNALVKLDKFDDCAKESSKDFVAASKGNTLLPSIAHGMAVPPAAEGAIKDAASKFWDDDKETAKDAQAEILKASKTK